MKTICDIKKITIKHRGESTTVSCKMVFNGVTEKLWITAPSKYVNEAAIYDAFTTFAIIPAMRFGGKISLKQPISASLAAGIKKIEEIYTCWYPKITKPIELDQPVSVAPELLTSKDRDAAACFFSGGVDSFYTYLKNADKLSTLFFVNGFDIFLDDAEARTRQQAHIEALKSGIESRGKEFIIIDTNLHEFSVKYTSWPQYYHGSALAGLSMLLSAKHSTFYIASTHSYKELFPYGSHALTDSLWSTEYVQLIHDGAESDRTQKTIFIANDELAQKHLRVCVKYNCSKCRKCTFTMIALDLAGVLEKCETFEHVIDISNIRKFRIPNKNQYIRFEEPYMALAHVPGKSRLRREIGHLLKDYNYRQMMIEVKKDPKGFVENPIYQELTELIASHEANFNATSDKEK